MTIHEKSQSIIFEMFNISRDINLKPITIKSLQTNYNTNLLKGKSESDPWGIYEICVLSACSLNQAAEHY